MYNEKPSKSLKLILLAMATQTSSDVEAESISSSTDSPFMSVTDTIIGSFVFEALSSRYEGGCFRHPF
jgi:hypothetical protein